MTLNGSVPDIEADQNFGSYGTATAATATELRLGFIWDGSGNGTAYVNNVAGTPSAHSFSFTTPGSLGAASGGLLGQYGK
jgi:hypothetical protein